MRGVRRLVLPAVFALMATATSRAGIIIDNFATVTPTITQTGNGTTTSPAVSGAGILGSRTISITVATPLTASSASAGVSPGFASAGFTGVYSPINMSNNFTLSETFASTNAITAGLNELSLLIASTAGTTVSITANGTSTYTFTDPSSLTGTGHNILFTSFSDPTVFTHLTSLTFVETFPNVALSGPSVSFTGPILLATSVPEPASIVMTAIAILSVGAYGAGRRFVSRKPVVA